MSRVQVLAISGSLRSFGAWRSQSRSSNTALLEAAIILAPADTAITLYPSLADLPHFNPDHELDPIPVLQDFRRQLRQADAVMICSPEYAHGVPGVMKNALDWVVGSGEFSGKPVAVLNASQRSHHAHASLLEILRTMDARIVEKASVVVPLLGRKLDVAVTLADEALTEIVVSSVKILTLICALKSESELKQI